MKPDIQKNNGHPLMISQKIILSFAAALLLAALAFGVRQFAAAQNELTHQLTDAEAIGWLEDMDRINYAIRLMNDGKVNEATRELQVRLGGDILQLRSELPFEDAKIELLANNLCQRVEREVNLHSNYSMTRLSGLPLNSANNSEGIDEKPVKSANGALKSAS
jgi:hypothetical protein